MYHSRDALGKTVLSGVELVSMSLATQTLGLNMLSLVGVLVFCFQEMHSIKFLSAHISSSQKTMREIMSLVITDKKSLCRIIGLWM